MAEPAPHASTRRIAALALPALGVLAAEPAYLLFDTAVVGRLGALALAGLAIGGLIVAGFAVSAVLCPLLVYGRLGLPRLELPGSAVANLAGQWVAALLFARALLVARVGLRPNLAVLQAAGDGPRSVRPDHGVSGLLRLGGRGRLAVRRGGGGRPSGRAATGVSLRWCSIRWRSPPAIFTNDPAVLARMRVPWWFLVAQLPAAGVVFGLDGVLLGAGDAKFMRNATLVSALAGFLPLVWLSLVFGWGLAGIWSGLSTFVLLRLLFVGVRMLGGRWAVPGTG